MEPIKKLPHEARQILRAMCQVTAKTIPMTGITEDQQVESYLKLLEAGLMRFVSETGDNENFGIQILMDEGWVDIPCPK